MRYADLHLHTVFSDGTYSPAELISAGAGAGLAAIAVVDHDSVGGIALTMEEGARSGIEVIPGIELTAEEEGCEIHILGYLIDYASQPLLEKLEVLKRNRIERIYKILEKLKDKMGVTLRPEAVFGIAAKGTVGRLHVAQAMVREKIVGSVFEAFKKYIGDKSPAYVLGFRFSPREAICLVREAKGIAVLAHPYSLGRDDFIPRFVKDGLMGIEVYYPEHTPGMTSFYLEAAKKYGLLVTGGSDCHGSAKPEVRIGSVKIPYELVEKLKDAKSKLYG